MQTQQEMFDLLTKRGYSLEQMGGGTEVFRRSNIIVSGADCDLPDLGWYCIARYQDWEGGDCETVLCQISDESAHPGDGNEPRNFVADLDIVERDALSAQD